jgi:probable HAF family extracellular repeat protein
MRLITCAILAAAVAACSNEAPVTQPPGALAQMSANARYQVARLPSLGGTLSRGMAINDRGVVAGWSNLADGTRRATLWRDGKAFNLGKLGGPNSTVPWPGQNNRGMIVGISQTAEPDPLHEDWSCEAGGFLPASAGLICRGFVLEHGVMRALPTLGGNHGFATAVNDEGQVVGWAETRVHDPTCTGTQILQFHAVLWEPRRGVMRDLRPFPGDSASAATAINEHGQVVGISGDCDQAVGRFSARRAVLWDHGRTTRIPDLGGTSWNTPMDINDRGDVVGFSNPNEPGDAEGDFISRAFLWNRGSAKATDLHTLPGDFFSEAFAINARGQVVGVSFGGLSGARAFLFQDGVMMNLNDLVGPGFPDVLLSAQDINDAGQITGRLKDHVTGETLAFVATPTRR